LTAERPVAGVLRMTDRKRGRISSRNSFDVGESSLIQPLHEKDNSMARNESDRHHRCVGCYACEEACSERWVTLHPMYTRCRQQRHGYLQATMSTSPGSACTAPIPPVHRFARGSVHKDAEGPLFYEADKCPWDADIACRRARSIFPV